MKEIGLYVVKDRAFTPKGIISFTQRDYLLHSWKPFLSRHFHRKTKISGVFSLRFKYNHVLLQYRIYYIKHRGTDDG